MHSFQVDGTHIAPITSAGLTIRTSLAATQSWVQQETSFKLIKLTMWRMITLYSWTKYTQTMYIGQSGDQHLPYSSNGDGTIYLAQDDDFVIHTNINHYGPFSCTAW